MVKHEHQIDSSIYCMEDFLWYFVLLCLDWIERVSIGVVLMYVDTLGIYSTSVIMMNYN